jgi:hypothetical protein
MGYAGYFWGALRVVLLDWTKTDESGDVPPYDREGLDAGEELGSHVEARWDREARHAEGKSRGP